MAMLEIMLRLLLFLWIAEIVAISGEDRMHMRAALKLAEQAAGVTSPNPCVGCLIVATNGTVIGRGWHRKAGGPHAEANALAGVNHTAINCTAYVTLEPCNHFGKTPPCSQALLKAGIKRVVAGTVDPDPRVSGKGIAYLQENGVKVDIMDGEETVMCQVAIAPFIYRVLNSKPYLYRTSLTLKALLHLTEEEEANRTDHAESLRSSLSPVLSKLDRMDTIVLDAKITRTLFIYKVFFGISPLLLLENLFLSHQLSSIVVCVDRRDVTEEFAQFVSELWPRAVVLTNRPTINESLLNEVKLLLSLNLWIWKQDSVENTGHTSQMEYVRKRCGLELGSNGIIWVDLKSRLVEDIFSASTKGEKAVANVVKNVAHDLPKISVNLKKKTVTFFFIGQKTILQLGTRGGAGGMIFLDPFKKGGKYKNKPKRKGKKGSNKPQKSSSKDEIQCHLTVSLNKRKQIVWKNKIFWLPYIPDMRSGVLRVSSKKPLFDDSFW